MSQNSSQHNAKRLARLAAVQGLYQIELTHRSVKDLIKDFHDYPGALLNETNAGEAPAAVDQELFGNILNGVAQNTASLDEMLKGSLNAKFSADRIEILLKAILRAGAYELHHHGQVPAGVIINDYVDVAHAFFDAKEPGLVNGVLDKLAKNLRP